MHAAHTPPLLDGRTDRKDALLNSNLESCSSCVKLCTIAHKIERRFFQSVWTVELVPVVTVNTSKRHFYLNTNSCTSSVKMCKLC
jgi:hypothetical protein